MRVISFLTFCLLPLYAYSQNELILLKGHPGNDEFASIFQEAEVLYLNKAKEANFKVSSFGEKEHGNKQAFLEHLKQLDNKGAHQLWIILLGHGNSFEGSTNFHLRGDDLNHVELELACKAISRPLILIHTGTGSAPFLFKFSKKGRVCISATSSDQEEDFTRMHLKFAEALANPEADLDGDQQTSLFESFLVASKAVQDSYHDEQLIPSEEAIIDDNGDGMGTTIEWYDGLNPVTLPEDGELDGLRAHQIYFKPNPDELKLPAQFVLKRNELELKLKKLVLYKEKYRELDYQRLLDNRIHELAKLYIDESILESPEKGLMDFNELNLAMKSTPNVNVSKPTESSQNIQVYDAFMNQRDIQNITDSYSEIMYETELVHYEWLNSYYYESRASHYIDRAGAFWNQYRYDLDAEACFRLRGRGLLNLKSFPELKAINLSYCPINDIDIAYLRYYELEKLALKGTRITDLAFEVLKHNTNFRELILSETRLTDASSNYLQNYPLEVLDLSQTNISARTLRNISSCKNLKELHLNQTSITINDLGYLQAFKNLQALSINHLTLSLEQIRQLKQDLPKLSELFLNKSNFDLDELKTINTELQLKLSFKE